MTTTRNDNLFGDAELEDVDVIPRQKRLILMFGVALAAFVFIGVAATALILWLVLRTRDHIDPNHTVRQKYEARYATCIAGGGSKQDCAQTVFTQCVIDPWWTAARAPQRVQTCGGIVPKGIPVDSLVSGTG